MNWLMYIGGGCCFLILWVLLIMYLIRKALGIKGLKKNTLPISFFIPAILMWIWICIYIIKPLT